MPRRPLAVLTLAVSLAVVAPASARAEPPLEPAPTVSIVDNPFISQEQSLSECVSAAPRPGCGSAERGGWRQYTVFAVMLLAIALIGLRIVVGMRRSRQPEPEDSAGMPTR